MRWQFFLKKLQVLLFFIQSIRNPSKETHFRIFFLEKEDNTITLEFTSLSPIKRITNAIVKLEIQRKKL